VSRAELSNNSALVSKARSLLQKKHRRSLNLFLVEGESTILEGLKNNRILEIFYSADYVDTRKILENASKSKIHAHLVSNRTLSSISDTKSQSGIIAISNYDFTEASIANLQDFNKVIYLDSVRDPGNAGTIIRAAAAFGFDAVAFSEDSVDPFNPKTVRATTGSIFHVPVLDSKELSIFKSAGYDIFFTDANAEISITQINPSNKQVWVFSNEAKGLIQNHQFGTKVKIPIKSTTESLNVAQAATIVMFYLSSKM
jgi:RNA methyltransferase, TrmH family